MGDCENCWVRDCDNCEPRKAFECVNCGFECEIVNYENLDMGIAKCEKCGLKGLRQKTSPTTSKEPIDESL